MSIHYPSTIDSSFFPAHIQRQVQIDFGTQVALGPGLLVDALGFLTDFSTLGLEDVKSTFTLGVGFWPLGITISNFYSENNSYGYTNFYQDIYKDIYRQKSY